MIFLIFSVHQVHYSSNCEESKSADEHEAELHFFLLMRRPIVVKRIVLFAACPSEDVNEGADAVNQHVKCSLICGKDKKSEACEHNAHDKEAVTEDVIQGGGVCYGEDILGIGYGKCSEQSCRDGNQIFSE